MVVRFLSQTLDKLVLRTKLSRLRKHPSPEVVCEVVQCCIRLGEFEDGFRHAAEGVRQFPESEAVGGLLKIARRRRAERTVREARLRVKARSTPEVFLRLARDADAIHEHALARQALRECIQRFPTFSAAHVALAELVERRYVRDLCAVDGLEVVRLLRRACRIDPTEFTTALRLARFLAAIGRLREARGMASWILAMDERVDGARLLIERLDHVPDGEDEALDHLLALVEEKGRLPGDRGDGRRMRREVGRLRQRLPALYGELGARRSVLIDAEGSAFDEAGSLGNDALVGLARNLSQTAHLITRNTGFGPLRGVTVESSAGSLLLHRGLRCTVASLLPRTESPVGAQEKLARWAGSNRREQPS